MAVRALSNEVRSVCEFETDRLRVAPWHEIAERLEVDLAQVIARMLTVRATLGLPESWQGEHTAESASDWIDDRDAEASMLLVVESESGQPVGIVVLAEAPISTTEVDVRIGYLIAEGVWGQGLATELVSGLLLAVSGVYLADVGADIGISGLGWKLVEGVMYLMIFGAANGLISTAQSGHNGAWDGFVALWTFGAGVLALSTILMLGAAGNEFLSGAVLMLVGGQLAVAAAVISTSRLLSPSPP